MTRKPTEMELRVERVLARFDFDEDKIHIAREVIRAMRTPTTTMLREAGMNGVCSTEDVAWMWGEMIDAASP